MNIQSKLNVASVMCDPKNATKAIADCLFQNIYPLMLKIRNKLQNYSGTVLQAEIAKIQDVFALCASQINKCLQTLFDIFKTEHHRSHFMQDSRLCTLERLSWCINKLIAIEEKLETAELSNREEIENDSMLISPMYFVNWIDHTFEILAKLADLVYKTDFKKTEDLYNQWKVDILDCVTNLHVTLEELLLSAMTLCKYCLPSDQLVVKARCQVVLRESKALLSELVMGDLESSIKVTTESLRLPIMPSNINVLIDVLKDVLYALETNTNTALLALVVSCFSHNQSPVDVLIKHFANSSGTCSCLIRSSDDPTEDCSFVKDFDLYNERLLQIGSFAVSCSSDQSRILTLRSGLASLEALDPHLVPALMLSPHSEHVQLLTESWRREVQDIRNSIFLIVDPAAFAEKSKQMMHQTFLDLLKESVYNNDAVCSIINMGCVVYDFFSVYNKLEPDALAQFEKLQSLLADLNKVQIECKIVSNLLCSVDDFVYDVKKPKNATKLTMEQLIKRLKLLYTIVGRINSVLHPRENDDLFDCDIEDEPHVKNVTHTVVRKNMNTYVQSPRKPVNMSRSIFARTNNIRSSTNKFPLLKLTKNLKIRQTDELSFSVKLDELFNLSEVKPSTQKVYVNKHLESAREPSVLYNFSPKKRASLRKAVLNKHLNMPTCEEVYKKVEIASNSIVSDRGSLMDEATSLQITDILNQMSDITNTFVAKSERRNATQIRLTEEKSEDKHEGNILKIDINSTVPMSKHVWNIPVNLRTVDMALDDSMGTISSDVTQPSNVTTLERISDIDLVETKLNSLKTLDLETSL